jgi:hypothetical protein
MLDFPLISEDSLVECSTMLEGLVWMGACQTQDHLREPCLKAIKLLTFAFIQQIRSRERLHICVGFIQLLDNFALVIIRPS